MFGRTGKLYFTENEAARILGISVEQFRTLLTKHICDRAEDVVNASQTTFHASDIVLLKMFAGQIAQMQPPPAPEPQAVVTTV
jgi:hypothetical protein